MGLYEFRERMGVLEAHNLDYCANFNLEEEDEVACLLFTKV